VEPAGDWKWWAPGPRRKLHDRIGISEGETPEETLVVAIHENASEPV
jgi:hypothetical protein